MRQVWCDVSDYFEDHRDDWWCLNKGKMVGDTGDNARSRVVIVEVMGGVSAGFERHDGENQGEREDSELPGRRSPQSHRDPEGLGAHRTDHITGSE
jgi:hypothetical protein